MKKRLVALILCFFLTFQINFFGYSQAVEAGEFISGAVEFVSESQAFQFLCGLMGVTPSTAFVASAGGVAVAGTLMLQKFEQWVVEQAYPVNVAMWLSKLKSGIIDTKDACWSKLKEWILSDTSTSPSSFCLLDKNTYTPFCSYDDSDSYSINPHDNDICIFHYTYGGSSINYLVLSASRCNFSINTYSYGSLSDTSNYDFPDVVTDANNDQYYYRILKISSNTRILDMPVISSYFKSYFKSICVSDYLSSPSDLVISPGLDKLLNNGAIDDLDLDQVNKLPIGVQTGDITIALDNVIDKLGSIEAVLERIISGDLAIDKVRQAADVVPVTKTKEGTISDVVTENEVIPVEDYVSDPNLIRPIVVPPSYNPDDYTVTGLQDVFPFCIPFDLIDFIGVLKADPETPVFVINCSFLGKKFEDLTFTIDLKPFDPLAKICRYSELFLFCVGLIILTRNIIKG